MRKVLLKRLEKPGGAPEVRAYRNKLRTTAAMVTRRGSMRAAWGLIRGKTLGFLVARSWGIYRRDFVEDKPRTQPNSGGFALGFVGEELVFQPDSGSGMIGGAAWQREREGLSGGLLGAARAREIGRVSAQVDRNSFFFFSELFFSVLKQNLITFGLQNQIHSNQFQNFL